MAIETARGRAVGVVEVATRVSNALGRPDLGRELERLRERLVDPAFTVLVIGEFKQGKSSLINALLATGACPVDDDIATSVPTSLAWSEAWSASVLLAPTSVEDDLAQLQVDIPADQVHAYVTEAANPENAKQVRSVHIGLPAPLLRDGLVIIDTPGVGGLAGAHAAITLNALPEADAVLFVSDASQEYSGPELEFLATAMKSCPHVVGVLTKCDFYPEWRTILDLDRGHLAARGLDFPILPVSSELRRVAVTHQDGALNEESGFPALERWLREDIAAHGEALILGGVHTVVRRIVDDLERQYAAEREALTDPAARQRQLDELAAAKERADQLRQSGARWDVTLADGITDLERETTHDLDLRLRSFFEESDAAVEAMDPADGREEYEQWLYRKAAEHLSANDELVRSRVAELVGRVEAHFVEDSGAGGTSGGIPVEVGSLTDTLSRTGEVQETEHQKDRVGTAVAGLRGSYAGVMMFGIIGKLAFATVSLLNPVSLVLGGLLTVRTVKELRKQSLNQRRHTTKLDGQKYIGELSVASRKDNGDRLLRIRRQLRDRYQERAREYQETVNAALATAQAAARRTDDETQARLADVEAELKRIATLRSRVEEAFTS